MFERRKAVIKWAVIESKTNRQVGICVGTYEDAHKFALKLARLKTQDRVTPDEHLLDRCRLYHIISEEI